MVESKKKEESLNTNKAAKEKESSELTI